MTGRYDDIINLSHPTSVKHARMPLSARAAQFAPFAALTGYGAAIDETGRLTGERIELGEHEKAELDRRLAALIKRGAGANIRITYFVPDRKKNGGHYDVADGVFRRCDEAAKALVMRDGRSFALSDVIIIDGDFSSYDF